MTLPSTPALKTEVLKKMTKIQLVRKVEILQVDLAAAQAGARTFERNMKESHEQLDAAQEVVTRLERRAETAEARLKAAEEDLADRRDDDEVGSLQDQLSYWQNLAIVQSTNLHSALCLLRKEEAR